MTRSADPDQLYALITEIRKAFGELRTFSDGQIMDLGMTAAMRAVLEDLDKHGAQTVPDIARRKGRTRQHIQQLADALVKAGFAEFRDNPAHRRSRLLAQTKRGREVFSEIRRRERESLGQAAKHLDGSRIEATTDFLRELRKDLAGQTDRD